PVFGDNGDIKRGIVARNFESLSFHGSQRGRSPIKKGDFLPEGRRPSAHQAAKPQNAQRVKVIERRHGDVLRLSLWSVLFLNFFFAHIMQIETRSSAIASSDLHIPDRPRSDRAVLRGCRGGDGRIAPFARSEAPLRICRDRSEKSAQPRGASPRQTQL